MRQVLKEREGERVVRRDDRVFKISSLPADMENQFLWFRHFEGMPGVPRALSCSQHDGWGVLVIEYIEGQPLHRELALHPGGELRLLGDVLSRLHNFHRAGAHAQDSLSHDDFHNHYIGKVITRFARARKLLPFLDAESFRMNGSVVRNPYAIVEETAGDILKVVLKDANVGYTHGDPNLSNIIWSASDQAPSFIDPRGAFGTRRTITGDISYDAARISYCLDGFCDIIENHGVLHASDASGFAFELNVDPVFQALAPTVVALLTDEFPVTVEGLLIREALLYLSAIPLHSHNQFQMHALLARGIDCLSAAGFS